ncbi:hypothetical protein KI387_018728 [Taxus chinensis]|uniref:Glycosyltransferase n=1 Tax=Taxus chinensis TaxID=29808 RepID=A0AA38G520_TAXCH|nr:hypothetical protein KI387_018728 [Taxus chinensis]
MRMSGVGSVKMHAVVFAFPMQGHIIPTFNLAKKLAAKGVVVTIVYTHSCHARIIKSNDGRDPFADYATRAGLDIRSALVSDGLPLHFDRTLNGFELTNSLIYNMESHVEEFLRDLQSKEPPISCIIADTFFVWPRRIANKFGIPFVSFWTESVMVFCIFYNWDLLIKNGHHPFTGNEGEIIKYIPGAPSLKLTDLPSYLQEYDVSTPAHTLIFQAFQSARAADYIISNTVDELESRRIQELQLQSGIPFLSVGPLLPSSLLEDGMSKDDEMGSSMWAESDCTSWLDGKPKHSVIYVSFGSYANVSKAQIHEMAMGLLHSKRPFIWVLRRDIVGSDVHEDILPEGFLEESKEQGLVVEWLSQLDVLSHSSVGGFLTHCGWNSIMESLWFGVPMLAFPLVADQNTNCRLIVEEWGVGMRLGKCSRILNNMRSTLVEEEIAATIKQFMDMDGGVGTKIRRKVECVREVMKKAVTNGGSSHKNLDLFVEQFKGSDPFPFQSNQ